jgi:hypothetical protein
MSALDLASPNLNILYLTIVLLPLSYTIKNQDSAFTVPNSLRIAITGSSRFDSRQEHRFFSYSQFPHRLCGPNNLQSSWYWRSKTTEWCSWSLTYIQCRGSECVELYVYFTIRLHCVLVNSIKHRDKLTTYYLVFSVTLIATPVYLETSFVFLPNLIYQGISTLF